LVVVHSTLKPGNLLLDGKSRVRISGFHIPVYGYKDYGRTRTLEYAAPECLRGVAPTKKIDIFSFRLILYLLLVGESVFPKSADVA
jgi:serine/threonine protein kinase